MPATLSPPEMQQRDLTVRTLTLRADSINEAERSFEAVVATETPAQVFDMRSFEVIDEILVAEGGQFPERTPLLPNHRRFDVLDVIGSARQFRRDGTRWLGRGFVAEPFDNADEVNVIWKRVKDGHIRAVSIGYQVLEFVDIPARQSEVIRGRKYDAGDRTLRVTTKWQVHELSLTPIGADSEALIRNQVGRVAQKPRSYFR